MLRILTLFLIVSFLGSCTDYSDIEVNNHDDIVSTREKGYRTQLPQLEKDIQGCWVEKNENNSSWCFNRNELKWKGFTHITSFKKNEIVVGSLIFQVSKKSDSTLVLLNKTSNHKHNLVKELP